MSRVEKAKGIYRVGVQGKRERANVRSLTNPTVCSYHPAEILRKKAQFQLRPNVKDKEKPTRKRKERESHVEGSATTTSERDEEGSGRKKTQTKQLR
ncbi:hypothetical protein MTP99_004778 [Tenebrio molitor]|nr:hypothetical protein MTP99_004778 [Tenebrio molitor]